MLQGLLDGSSATQVQLSEDTLMVYEPWYVLAGGRWYFYGASGRRRELPVATNELTTLARTGEAPGVKITEEERQSLLVWLDQQLEAGNWRVQPYDEGAPLQESELRQRHWAAGVLREFPVGSKVLLNPGSRDDEGNELDTSAIYTVRGVDLDWSGSWPYVILKHPHRKGTQLADPDDLQLAPEHWFQKRR